MHEWCKILNTVCDLTMTVKFSWNISVKIHFNFLNVVGWVSQYLTHHWCMKFLWKRFYHETACSQQYLPAVLCETCTILACYQCACLALVRYWPWLLCGEANVLFKCASCCGEWLGVKVLKVRGSVMPSLSGWSVLTSAAGWLPESLSVQAADLSQAFSSYSARSSPGSW